MEAQSIYIKGMVCDRCVMTIKSEFETLGYKPVDVSLGVVKIMTSVDQQNIRTLIV